MHASRPDRVLHAPDAEQAIKEAIARYGISNPQEQARLPQRVKEIGWLPCRRGSPGAPRARLRCDAQVGSKALTPRVWLTATILDGVALRAIIERPKSRIGRGVSALVSAAAEIELHRWPAIPRPIARSVHRHTAAPVIKPAPATAVCGIGV